MSKQEKENNWAASLVFYRHVCSAPEHVFPNGSCWSYVGFYLIVLIFIHSLLSLNDCSAEASFILFCVLIVPLCCPLGGLVPHMHRRQASTSGCALPPLPPFPKSEQFLSTNYSTFSCLFTPSNDERISESIRQGWEWYLFSKSIEEWGIITLQKSKFEVFKTVFHELCPPRPQDKCFLLCVERLN